MSSPSTADTAHHLPAIDLGPLVYEERAISAALDDGVADSGWSESVLGFGAGESRSRLG